jgi:hypothetical protein
MCNAMKIYQEKKNVSKKTSEEGLNVLKGGTAMDKSDAKEKFFFFF